MKKIILGVTGSIAAYKSLVLTRLLVKAGHEVRVVMTPSAAEFVAPLSFSTLSKHDVHIDLIDGDSWSNHVELGLWADAMIIAPATANTLGKMANGICDTMLLATYLSAKCPVFFAPAMDLDMWQHPSTKHNVETLKSYGNVMIPVGDGELASGLVGEGRMAEPEDIVTFVSQHMQVEQDLAGKQVLITAGPTREALDPVRYISNHSTGRMGIALAEVCAARGGMVHLVLGPTELRPDNAKINVIQVVSAQDMYEACAVRYEKMDVVIYSAAVADYRPAVVSDIKIKKKTDDMAVPLERTTDIAATLNATKRENQIAVGFALETNNEESNAQKKLDKKNFDMIVLNSLRVPGAGFKHDTNKVTIYVKGGKSQSYPLKSKKDVAQDIVDQVVPLLRS